MASSLALSKESDSSFAVSAVKLLFVIKNHRLGVNLDNFLVFMGNCSQENTYFMSASNLAQFKRSLIKKSCNM